MPFTPFNPTSAPNTSSNGTGFTPYVANSQTPQTENTPAPSFLQKTTNVVNSLFPGKQIGQALGNSIYGIGQAAKGAFQSVTGNKQGAQQSFQNAGNAANENNANFTKIAGDTAGVALAGITPLIGGATPLARIGANTALGAGIGTANAVANGSTSGKDIATQGATGAVLGGATTAIGEGISKLAENLPSWFVKKALPKLDPDKVDFALQNLDAGSIKSNLAKSSQAVASSGNAIDSILNHPQYAEETGNLITKNAEGKAVSAIADQVISKYPNAQLTESQIASKIKSVAPLQKDLIDKVMDGTASILQQNKLRQTLDQAIYPKFTDTPSLTSNKQIAKVFTDALRNNVQTTAPETKPIFEQFAKEINLKTALTAAKIKLDKGSPISLYDIVAGVGGGIPGIVGERVGRSPAALISGAKGIQALNKAGSATGKALNAVKAPLLKATSQKLSSVSQ